MRRLASLGATVSVVALALSAVGCGGDSGGSQPTAGEWAEDFCTAVTTWAEEIGKIGQGVGDPSSLSADTLEQAAREANEATDEFVDDIRALGTPDIESGEDVKASLEEFADSVEAERDKIGDASERSDTAAAVTAIGASLSAMSRAFQSTLGALEDADVSGELETALEESSVCDAIVELEA